MQLAWIVKLHGDGASRSHYLILAGVLLGHYHRGIHNESNAWQRGAYYYKIWTARSLQRCTVSATSIKRKCREENRDVTCIEIARHGGTQNRSKLRRAPLAAVSLRLVRGVRRQRESGPRS